MSKTLSIASDFTRTVAGHLGLCTTLAFLEAKEHTVKFYSSAPPTGFTLKMFRLQMNSAISGHNLNIDVEEFTRFQKKDPESTSKPHFNIVFDDEDVHWCTYDYHVRAETPAFEAIIDKYTADPNQNIVEIIEQHKTDSGLIVVNSLVKNSGQQLNRT